MAKAAKQGFQIPTVDEVVAFIDKSMKDWPQKFCRYYGEKFYHHYAARGWRLSKNIVMRDWHAAFFSQWREVQFAADQKMLEACYREPAHLIAMDRRRRESAGLFAQQESKQPVDPLERALDYADYIMSSYVNGEVQNHLLRRAWDWLTQNKILTLTPDQENEIALKSGNDGDARAIMQVKFFFQFLKVNGQTVKRYVHSKMMKA